MNNDSSYIDRYRGVWMDGHLGRHEDRIETDTHTWKNIWKFSHFTCRVCMLVVFGAVSA
jgi:hypothetical protein